MSHTQLVPTDASGCLVGTSILDHERITDGDSDPARGDLPSLHQLGLGVSPAPWNLPCSGGLAWLLCSPLALYQLDQAALATKDREDISLPEVAGLLAGDFSRRLMPPLPLQEDCPMLF